MINFDWRLKNSSSNEARPLKRSTMLSIIALTTLTSMTVTSCAQTQSLSKEDKEKEEKKDEQNSTTSSGHSSHYHGGHGVHFSGNHISGSGSGSGSGSALGSQSREKEFGRVKGGSRSSTTFKTSGYQAPPANAWGGVSRGWFGRFCGSVFGG